MKSPERPKFEGRVVGAPLPPDAALATEDATVDLITDADLADHSANDHRRRVFAAYRGYGTGQPSYLPDGRIATGNGELVSAAANLLTRQTVNSGRRPTSHTVILTNGKDPSTPPILDR